MSATKDRRGQGSETRPDRQGQLPPHDVELERDLLAGFLIDPARDDLERLAGSHPGIFYAPANLHVAQAIIDTFNDSERITLGRLAERLAGRAYPDPPTARHALKDLADRHTYRLASSVGTGSINEAFDTLERYRRQRLMAALAGELREGAYSGVEWHTKAEEIFELAHTNGAVAKLSTLEVIDLGPILRGDTPDVVPVWLARTDGKALLYPGRVHDFHAEPSVGKTWLALTAVAEVLRAGGNAIYLDLEDTARNAIDRLRKLNVTDAELADNRFAYINAPGGFQAPERNEVFTICDDLNPDLVIIDGVAEALARDGLDENSNADVVLWAERLPRPLARRGAAVVMLDHVVKSPENRSRGARGAGAKLAIIDGVSYDVRLAKAYSATREGLIKLIVAKDRPGLVGAIGEAVAGARIVPHEDGLYVEVILEAPPPPDATFKPTGVMERIAERLAAAEHPVPERWLYRSLRAKRPIIEEALAGLVIDGYVAEVRDANNPRVRAYRLIKPYRDPSRTGSSAQDRAAGDVIDATNRFTNTEPEPPPELFDEPPEED